MVQINFAMREVSCKIVYYGPGMSGKTTNLEVVHLRAPEDHRGELTSIATDGDRTLFFDFMPLDLGTVAGMRTKFHLYTVPGQVYYNSTRKLVLQGVDGVVFVADSSPAKAAENLESMENLEANLREYGRELRDLPHVIQFNKRDLPDAMTPEEMNRQLNRYGAPTFQAVGTTGEGVFPTLKALAGMVLESINRSENRRPAASAPPGAPALGAPASKDPSREVPAFAGATSPRPSGGMATPSAPSSATGAAAAGGRISRWGSFSDSPAGAPPSRAPLPPSAASAPASAPPRGSGRSAPAGGMVESGPPVVRSRIGSTPTAAAPGRAPAPPKFSGGGPSSPAPAPRTGRLSPATLVLAVVFGAVLTGAAFGLFLLLR